MKGIVIVPACLASLIMVSGVYGQQPPQPAQHQRGLAFGRDPCPGGVGTSIIDLTKAFGGSEAFAIHDLIQASQLIIQGTIVRVLPLEVVDGNPPNIIHTTSLISVDEVLR